jgi:pimeloyl-ACP methyl ester carboxylesterase
MQTADHVVEGVRCAVYDSDPGKREAVVFVHGNPGPMDDWEGLAPAVAACSRVVAMDMPGYGRADHPRNFDYTVEGYGRYLGGLLDQLGVERAHLVVHDFGGAWGLRWAVDHPSHLGSLTLVNFGIFEGYKWHGFARIWQTPILGEIAQLTTTKWGMKRAINGMSPKPMPDAFFDRVMKYSDWGHRRAVLKLYRASKDLLAVRVHQRGGGGKPLRVHDDRLRPQRVEGELPSGVSRGAAVPVPREDHRLLASGGVVDEGLPGVGADLPRDLLQFNVSGRERKGYGDQDGIHAKAP